MTLPPVPVAPCQYRRLPSRAVPLSVYATLYGDQLGFAYESLEAHGGRGRYSFIGGRPRAVFAARRDQLSLTIAGETHHARGDALEALRRLVPRQPETPPIAPFCGGAVGYLGYDTIRLIERIPDTNPDELDVPDALFLVPSEVIVFDHLDKIAYTLLYLPAEACSARFDEIERVLQASEAADPPAVAPALEDRDLPPEVVAEQTRAQFESAVRRAQEYIHAGDIFQVVLSQRFRFPVSAPPLSLYRALRQTNPSPYMYYLNLGELQILGSSPEILVKLNGRRAVTRPLAGTRRRGRTAEEDHALAVELQHDEKERAEHVMLVDLGRNDLGRVSEFGTVKVTDVLAIERHSKVMHLVSNVDGWLRADRDAIDLFKAVFPAGTVSGAPKVRAMEIIEELEPSRRGVYAGAIGYLSVLGDMDLCIAIRTIVVRGDRGYIQAGAGIVADSQPDAEYRETLNKARALMNALRLARA